MFFLAHKIIIIRKKPCKDKAKKIKVWDTQPMLDQFYEEFINSKFALWFY